MATAGVLVNDVATMATSMQRSLSDRIAIVEGRHVISGQSVALRASPPEGTVGIPFASVIATSPAQEGVVMLSADSMATMRGGLAYVSCSNVLELGNIMVNCSAGGVITLQQGILPVAPRIVLNDLGIKLSVGTASISLNAETGISLMFGEFTIKINEAGIQMSVAENSADISEAGITLSAADSTIEMTPAMISADSGATGWDISAAGFALDGPTIDLGCDAMYSLECAVLMESVDGAVERTAGIAMVE